MKPNIFCPTCGQVMPVIALIRYLIRMGMGAILFKPWQCQACQDIEQQNLMDRLMAEVAEG